ncbi:prolyl oligopeptidase family serine peptidase [Gallaecimonas sp. GXIMD4217]|uniref:S9 family peptidase n=1 Tax=Gallaecimonas sp. GXIMD4217 TaxID=3131927 RepID=UPI00311B0390
MTKAILPLAMTVLLSACAGTQGTAPAKPMIAGKASIQVPAVQATASGHPTLEKIMSDPQWIARSPQQPFFGADGRIYFWQQREGSHLHDLMTVRDGTVVKVADEQRHRISADGAWDQAGERFAYAHEGNVFLSERGQLRQLTGGADHDSNPSFLTGNRLAFQRGNAWYQLDLQSGLSTVLAELELKDQPKGIADPEGHVAKEQHRLINWVANNLAKQKAGKAEDDRLKAADPTANPDAFYLGDKRQLVESALSHDGRYLLVVTQEDKPTRSDSDVMPNYLGQAGEIEVRKVRQRVADWQPNPQRFTLIDLQSREMRDLKLAQLPGINSDPLAKVRAENRQAGYQVEEFKGPRAVQLMQDWGWRQSAMQWSRDGKLAVMLEAQDNKDRWLVTVDLDSGSLTTQHRLQDEAWINYDFNDFGWLPDGKLWYLSEQSGFSHVYVKPLAGQARQLTRGAFEVSKPVLSRDGRHLYYKANEKHPGIYEVYRLDLHSGQRQALSDLDGMTDFVLSPAEDQLLLSHSKVLNPPELYLLDAQGGQPRQLTHTVSDEFAKAPWTAPKVVAVPSSHTEQPIYAKLYLPKDFDAQRADKYPAVVFNHGAGYLQNSHLGWSGYFREFMFHSLLTEQGYVVMDMDYRASKGYGRDWRTAIYRQMGTPEVQDLRDGVAYLGERYNVDTGKVGTYGGSYGGFLTFMSLFTAPDLFQAGAALRPVTDWAHYNAPYTSNILNRPQVDPLGFERSSPLYLAEGLEKPLLIMSGVLDDNVFFQDSVRLVQRLIELKKPMFETAIYPVEPHGFREPSSWLDEYRRIHRLMEENLK